MPATRDVRGELLGQTVGGRYRILKILGEGGMGTVYEAEHVGLGRPVAVKVLNPAQAKKRVAIKRFQQEARAAGAIGHPNICEVYDMGLLDDGSPYLVMEKLLGTTLSDRILREGGLPFDDIVDVMIQVLSGLVAAHEKGIVHRDIKPENIFLARRAGCAPIAKILDFGVSKMLPQFNQGEVELDLTRTGMVMGTPYYMSPEQARGERNLDGRVDVYACGVMMYESIVGKRPFIAPNYNALLLAIINTTPTPLREHRPATPPAITQIVERAMAKLRADRFASAMHFLEALHALPIARRGASRPPPPLPGREPRPARVRGRPHHDRALDADSSTRTERQAPREAPPRDAPLPRRSRPSESTRIDVKPTPVPPPPVPSDSVEIPIEVTDTDIALGPPAEERPTEIFRPIAHAMAAPLPKPVPLPPPSVPPRRAPLFAAPPIPVPADEWESETVVNTPPHLPPVPRPRPREFSADETIRVDREIGLEFRDETTRGSVGRRRR